MSTAETNPKIVAGWAVDHATTIDARLAGSRSIRVQAMTNAIRESGMTITAEEAVAAVNDHYARSAADLVTGEGMVALVRRARQRAALRDASPPANTDPEPERRTLPASYAEPWTDSQREAIESFVCPWCKAAVDEPCENRSNGQLFLGGDNYHPQRVTLTRHRPAGA